MRRGDQPRHVGWIVGEVAVHLEDEVGVERERVSEALEVCGAEAFLPRPVNHAHPRPLHGEPVGEFAGAVGRAVVDDDHEAVAVEHVA